MSEDPRDDCEFLALFEPECRARMAQVVEALTRESGRLERRLEAMQHVRRVE